MPVVLNLRKLPFSLIDQRAGGLHSRGQGTARMEHPKQHGRANPLFGEKKGLDLIPLPWRRILEEQKDGESGVNESKNGNATYSV